MSLEFRSVVFLSFDYTYKVMYDIPKKNLVQSVPIRLDVFVVQVVGGV